MRRLAFAAVAAALLWSGPAWTQGTLLQGGPIAPGRVPMYLGAGTAQAVVQDSGPAGGGAKGLGLAELLMTKRGAGTPPYAGGGTGPLGTTACMYDAPTTNPTGYHYLCLDPNAQGGGLIAYGAGGAAASLPLSINVNGSSGVIPGVTLPVVANHIAIFSGTSGLLKDSTIATSNGSITTTVADAAGVNLRSGASGNYTLLDIGRTAQEGVLGVAGVANQFFTGTVAGDFALKGTNSNSLWFGIGGLAAAGYINASNQWVFGNVAAAPGPDAVLTVSSNTSPLPTNPDASEQWPLRVGAADNKIAVVGIDSFGVGVLSALVFEHARGTNASKSAVQSGDLVGAVTAHGYYTGGASGYSGGFAQLRFIAAGNFSDTSQPGQASIWTTPVGSTAGSLVEVARFDQDRSSKFFGSTDFTGGNNTFTDANASAISVRSGVVGSYTAVGIGRTAEEGVFGVAGLSDQFFTGTVAGDIALKGTNSNTLWLGIGGLAATAKFDSSKTTTLFGALTVNNTSATSLPAATGPIQFAAVDGAETVLTADTFGNIAGSLFLGRSARGTAVAPTATQVSDILSIFGGMGRGATVYSGANAQIRVIANQTFTDAAQGTRLGLYTTRDGSTGASLALALTVQSSGGVSVGSAPDPGVNAIASAAYFAGATAGVSCSGAPTGSFASINGITTHC